MMVSPCCLSEMEEMGDCPACGVSCYPIGAGSISPERMVRALLEAIPGSGDPLIEHMRVKRTERAALAWLRAREWSCAVSCSVGRGDVESELGLSADAADTFLRSNHKLIRAAMWDGARDAMEALKP